MSRCKELEALAARVEALTGPCRETDALVYEAKGGCVHREWRFHEYASGEYYSCKACGELQVNAPNRPTPRFTASLDAAMTLAFDKRIAQFGGPLAMLRWAMEMLERAGATADALPRYVTAASLRAIAAQEPAA